MPVITIRGNLGSGAPEIGKEVARRLNIDYIDREIIADVAARINWAEEGIEKKEMPPGTLLGRIAEALGHSYAISEGYESAYLPTWEMPLTDTQYLAGLKSVIQELAKNQSVVIHGRGSQFILKDLPGAVHVFVIAPFEFRIKQAMSSLNLDETNAKKEIERSDNSRRQFVKRYFNAELENPLGYDIVVNTERMSFDDAVSIIIHASSLKGKADMQQSKL